MARKHKKQQETKIDNEDAENEQIVQQQATHFFSKDVVMPQEIYFLTLSFLPAFPCYFQLRRVSKGWKAFMEEKMYDFVQELNLLPNKNISKELADKVLHRAVIEFLPQVVPNVKRLYVPLQLWTSVKATIVNQNICKWNDLEVHVFPCHNDTNQQFNISLLPQVKTMTFYAFRCTKNIFYGGDTESSTKFVLKYPTAAGHNYDSASTPDDIKYKFVSVENFTDLRDQEQYFQMCKYFVGMSNWVIL